MRKAEKEELDTLFASFVKKFQSRCWTCHGKYNNKEAFVIHHRTYKDGEKTYKDFKLPNGKPDKLSYYRYLTPIILKEPKRFRLLHHKHHFLCENQARLKPDHFRRTHSVSLEINKRRYNY